MQCYSAYSGTIDIPYTLVPVYQNFGLTAIDKDPKDPLSDWEVNVNWESEWLKRAVYFKGYKGVNVLMIDAG